MIRKMSVTDIDVVLKLEDELFTSKWTQEQFEYELTENEFSKLFVMIENEEIIGYFGEWILFDQAQITTIGVSKKHQGKGYSKLMMQRMIEEACNSNCETISLEVRVSNVKAINLYHKFGFETINIRKNYYQDNNEDAFLMMKAIGGLD